MTPEQQAKINAIKAKRTIAVKLGPIYYPISTTTQGQNSNIKSGIYFPYGW